MEKQSFFARCCAAFKTLVAFGCQHAASMAVMDKTYTRCWCDYYLNEKTTQLLRIRRCGHVYEVSRGYEDNGKFRVSEKWLAAYSWHSSGHLIALGKMLNIYF
ncbi:MAG: hypothetical protein JKY70_13475, partial [Mucilaginibacter sp.]|nr:hypothetical protein [Mucilaginibacter sp.]